MGSAAYGVASPIVVPRRTGNESNKCAVCIWFLRAAVPLLWYFANADTLQILESRRERLERSIVVRVFVF